MKNKIIISEEIKIIFRKDKKNSEIIAFLPESTAKIGHMVCYDRVSSHSEASYDYYLNNTTKATPEEYEQLLKIMKHIYEEDKSDGDFTLVIKQKINHNDLTKAWSWRTGRGEL